MMFLIRLCWEILLMRVTSYDGLRNYIIILFYISNKIFYMHGMLYNIMQYNVLFKFCIFFLMFMCRARAIYFVHTNG